MQDLIEQLKTKAGLTDDQAMKALLAMKDYIHAKVPPMFSGIVDNFLGDGFKDSSENKSPQTTPQDDFLDRANKVTKETTEKIEVIAEEAKEGVEHFAKEATERIDIWAEKGERAAKEVVEKLRGIIEEKHESGK